MQQAVIWEAENTTAAPSTGTVEAVLPATAPTPTLSAEIERLAALHAGGVLTDEEFQAAKRSVIGL